MDQRKFPFKLFILSTIISISSTSDDYCATGFDYSKYDGMYVISDEPVYSQQYNDMYSSDYVEINEPVYYGLSSHRYMYRYYCDTYTCQGYSWRFGQNTRGVTPELMCDSASVYPPSSCEWYAPGFSDTFTQSVRINSGECVSTTEKPIEFSNCTIVSDDMGDPESTGWVFENAYGSVISTPDNEHNCADAPCTVLEGNYPMMTKEFKNMSFYSPKSVQIIYFVQCHTAGYLVQYKWGINSNWMDLYYTDEYVLPINYLHNLEDPPDVNVDSLFIRFKFNYQGSGSAQSLYIDNFYLKAATPSCPEEKQTTPKSTKISLTSETVIIAGAVLLIVICCCVICFCSRRSKSKKIQSKDVPTEFGRTRNHQPQINTICNENAEVNDNPLDLEVNTADNENAEGDDNQLDLEVNTAVNEEAEGDDIRTVVTCQ